jgi:hypothetical protein
MLACLHACLTRVLLLLFTLLAATITSPDRRAGVPGWVQPEVVHGLTVVAVTTHCEALAARRRYPVPSLVS